MSHPHKLNPTSTLLCLFDQFELTALDAPSSLALKYPLCGSLAQSTVLSASKISVPGVEHLHSRGWSATEPHTDHFKSSITRNSLYVVHITTHTTNHSNRACHLNLRIPRDFFVAWAHSASPLGHQARFHHPLTLRAQALPGRLLPSVAEIFSHSLK